MSYADIMSRYVADLAAAHDEVTTWWARLLQDASPAGDAAAAEKAVRARWPLGPVSHPRIVAVYRQYFLETEAYNEAKREDPSVGADDDGNYGPGSLLLDTLDAHDAELATFMQGFVFTSIGTDPDGNAA